MVLRDGPQRGLVRELQRLLEALPGMGGQPLGHPGQIVGIRDAVEQASIGRWEQDQLYAVDGLTEGADGIDDRSCDVGERLAVEGIGGVEEHQAPDAVRHRVGCARDHHAAVAVSDQDHVSQVLECEHRCNVLDVTVQIHISIQQVGPLAQAGHGRCVDDVSLRLQDAGYSLVAPAAVAATMHEHIGRHAPLLLIGAVASANGSPFRST